MTAYQQLSELELIDRVIGGDIAVYEVLMRRYNPYLYKVGRSYGYNHQDVEDIMQETFISAYQSLGKLENKLYFKTWLIRIMLNKCYRLSNKAASKKEITVDVLLYEKSIPMFSVDGNDDPERNVNNRELSSVIENAINRIPHDYRLVFSLRELNGMSVFETATALHLTEANVKVRLNRAKAMLRKEIESMYSPEDIFQFNLVYCDKIVANVMEKISALNSATPSIFL